MVLLPPGIEVFPRTQVASGTATTLVVSRFLNSLANTLMEARVRLLQGSGNSIPVDLYADVQDFTFTADVVTANTDSITITGTSEAQQPVDISVNPATPTTGNKLILFAPHVLGGKSSYSTPTAFSEYYQSAGVYVATTATITSSSFELPTASTASADFILVDVNTAQVSAVYTLTPSASILTCTLISSEVSAMTKSDATGVIAYKISWNSPCVLPAGSSV